ncbi:MAG: preprotein translocase SecY subunit [Verrucomicrobiota bacterium]
MTSHDVVAMARRALGTKKVGHCGTLDPQATGLLIIVVVTMDFWAQVQSYVMSQQYESLLKKANFKAG